MAHQLEMNGDKASMAYFWRASLARSGNGARRIRPLRLASRLRQRPASIGKRNWSRS